MGKRLPATHFVSNVDANTATGDCSACGRVRLRRNHNSKRGVTYWTCDNKYQECQARYRTTNKELLREKAKDRLKRRYCDPAGRQAILESNRAWRERNPEKVSAQNKKWDTANKDRAVALANKRRGSKNHPGAELISRRDIYERDEATCGICGGHVEWEDFHMDHVVPLSKGGTHTVDNVQCAHSRCNQRKYNKVGFKLPSHRLLLAWE